MNNSKGTKKQESGTDGAVPKLTALEKQLARMEAVADLLQEYVVRFKTNCHGARVEFRKLEGVSTPSNARKGDLQKAVAAAVAKRNQRILNPK